MLGLASLITVAGPLAAQAASYPAAATAPQTATYPPASPGTFSVTARPGSNPVTINGLGRDAEVTVLVSGRGPAPALGPIHGTPKAQTANLAVGKTDASGSITFSLVFASHASGVYNVSVSTPDGHSVSGSVTLPEKSTSPLNFTGTNIALWVVCLAGILIVVSIIGMLTSVIRRRARG